MLPISKFLAFLFEITPSSFVSHAEIFIAMRHSEVVTRTRALPENDPFLMLPPSGRKWHRS